MRWPRRLGMAAAGLLAVLALAIPLRAQAWLPPQGEAFFSLGYSNIFATKHYNFQGEQVNNGHLRGQSVGAQVGYAFTDRLTVQFGVPYTEAKWYRFEGQGKQHVLLDGTTLDDGQYHGTFADFRIDALYQVIHGPTVLTPFVSVVIPTHDYQYFAHTAVGRGLNEYILGLNFGSSLERIVPGLFVQAMYSYAFVEEVLNIHHDRSNGALEVGYFITPSIGVRFLASGFYTHGGRVILSPADYHCANPNACTAADPLFLHHDQIGHASAISLGGGLSYALTGSVDVYATYLRNVEGRGGHKLDHGLALGFSWGFSPKQVIRRMFGPRMPVGETPLAR